MRRHTVKQIPWRVRASLTVVALLYVSHAATVPAHAQDSDSNAPRIPPRTTVYVDSISGDDRNNGLSPRTAWNTLARVNRAQFSPGCRILLRAGSDLAGPLELRGSGAENAPIAVGRYESGPSPRIRDAGAEGAVVALRGVEFWEIADLELIGGRTGVLAQTRPSALTRHLVFRRLDIRDVRGGLVGDDGGFLCRKEGDRAYFDDLRIEDCTVEHVDRNGILVTDWPAKPDDPRSTRVVIRGNRLTDIGGDGIFILGCKGAVIERNVLRYAHQRVGRGPGERACAGIWPQRSIGTLIQFNEVSHTAVGGRTVWDSEAFDDDASCENTVFQYNYSHDNAGGFLLLCGGKGAVVRYNISQNDAIATFSIETDNVRGALIYNNTIYVGAGRTVNLARNTMGSPRDIRFFNNLLYADGEMTYDFGSIKRMRFQNNAYFGTHRDPPSDPGCVTANPLLQRPGGGGDGMQTARAYMLRSGSPCGQAGRPIAGNGKRDFFGRRVPTETPPSIGACQP